MVVLKYYNMTISFYLKKDEPNIKKEKVLRNHILATLKKNQHINQHYKLREVEECVGAFCYLVLQTKSSY